METIYFAMALTHAPTDFVKMCGGELRKIMRKFGYRTLDFVGLADGTAEDVYLRDMHAVCEADLLVAICDYPSLGLGMEVMARIHAKKPLVLCWRRGTKITRMLIGASVIENIRICQYDTIDDIARVVRDMLPQNEKVLLDESAAYITTGVQE